MKIRSLTIAAMSLLLSAIAQAQPIFSDDFENGLSLLWGNERGNWVASGGVYGAMQPSNNPCTYSSLPFTLADMEIECDVLGTIDGGVWLHTNPEGTNGVLFVLAHNKAYWHTVTNNNFSGPLSEASGVFTNGQNLHLRITVTGSTFRAYINGSASPTTTLTNANFPGGRVGLYDFTAGSHNYDNVVVSGQCVSGTCCPYISRDPQPVTICPSGAAHLHAQGAGSSLAQGWEYEIRAGEWLLITEGPNYDGDTFLFNAAGSATTDLTLDRGELAWSEPFNIHAIVSNDCGQATSKPAPVSLCPPDFDCSGFSDTDDFTAFVLAFEAGTDDADFDGTGFVDTDDFTAFVLAFEAGC